MISPMIKWTGATLAGIASGLMAFPRIFPIDSGTENFEIWVGGLFLMAAIMVGIGMVSGKSNSVQKERKEPLAPPQASPEDAAETLSRRTLAFYNAVSGS